MGKLTAIQVQSLSALGLHGDGGTLYLRVAPGGSKSWIQRVTVNGRRRDIGLGGWPVASLAKARERAFAKALVRGCGQAYALQTVEPVTYRCSTRRVCQARSSGSERYTRARPHAVAPMNCVPEDSRRRSRLVPEERILHARLLMVTRRLLPPSPSERLHPPDRPIAGT